MKFVQKVLQDSELETPYALAKALTEKYGQYYAHTKIMHWVGKTKQNQRGINLRDLCRLREISGKSWKEFGAELDDEFLHQKE